MLSVINDSFLFQDLDLCVPCYQKEGHEHKMEELGSGIDLEAQAGNKQTVTAQEQRRQSVQRCIQSLEHATYCDDHSCQLQMCLKMKKAFAHSKQCKRKTNGGCPNCKILIALCCYHAKHCTKTNCMIPYCSHLKQKLRQQLLQQRLQQTQLMRRRIQAMQAGAQRPPPLPVPAVPPSIPHPVQPVPPQAPVQTIPQKPVSVHPVQLPQNLPGAGPPSRAVNAAAQVAQQINKQIAARQAQPPLRGPSPMPNMPTSGFMAPPQNTFPQPVQAQGMGQAYSQTAINPMERGFMFYSSSNHSPNLNLHQCSSHSNKCQL